MRARLLAELLGTSALVFAGCGAMAVNDLTRGALGVVGMAAVFGLVVLAMIHALGDVSGAHFIRAVSLAFWRAGRLPGRDAALYALAQLTGAIAAAGALEALFGSPISGASMNPARSLGPALMTGHIGELWIYCAAPIIGMLAAVRLCLILRPGGGCCAGACTTPEPR